MVAFNKAKGQAQKGNFNQYEYKMGDNKVRLVGEVLPRYVYWIQADGRNIPMECLSFDRDQEAFTNKEKDWVREYFPDLKCGWAYAMYGIDNSSGTPQLVVVNLKKKLFQSIIELSERLGDPTDPETGWDVHFTKKKTGPHAYNVEYTLDQLGCMEAKRPLNEAELALMAEATPIDTLFARPTPDAQKELLERVTNPQNEEENRDESAVDELEDAFDID